MKSSILPDHGNRDEPHGGLGAALIVLGILVLVAVACNQKSVDQHLITGDRAMRDGKVADAEREYQTATQLAPADPRAHLALASLYASEQKPVMAQQERMKALDLDPQNAGAHAALAQDYALDSQLAMAEEQYRAAIALNPGQSKYHLELGSVLASENDPSEAEAEMRAAIGLDPRDGQAHFRLAKLLSAESGREEEARAEFEQARALDPALTLPNAPAAPGAADTTVSKASIGTQVEAINKRFLLTRNSQVYQQPAPTSLVVAQVRKRKFVNVTGITGDWLRIKLRSGTVGFIPVSAAE
jgi:Flp pilus assembly protein TadD